MDEVAVTILPHPVTTFILGIVFLGMIILWFEYRSMKNVEKADRVHLGSLIDSLKKGHYVIPDFQRDKITVRYKLLPTKFQRN